MKNDKSFLKKEILIIFLWISLWNLVSNCIETITDNQKNLMIIYFIMFIIALSCLLLS